MIVNFIRLRNNLIEDNSNHNTYDENNTYNLCIVSSFVFIIYFLLTVPMLFMDIILGIMYEDNCILESNININDWLIVNGVICYLHLFILILLKRVYREDTFFKKLLKYSGYIVSFIILIWSIIGVVTFFKYYYNNINQICSVFFYNYLFIRIILAPLITVLRFVEMYSI